MPVLSTDGFAFGESIGKSLNLEFEPCKEGQQKECAAVIRRVARQRDVD